MREKIETDSETQNQDSPYWADKGNPKESFDVVLPDGRKIDVKNFSDVGLSTEQLDQLGMVASKFFVIGAGSAIEKVQKIYIDDKQLYDPEFQDGVNGMGVENSDGIIKLYPKALKPIEHRVKGVSNFEGTLVHEFSHALMVGLENENAQWEQEFGWQVDSKKLNELRRLGLISILNNTPQKDWTKIRPDIWNLVRCWKTSKPEACVTDYARLAPEDDFADSMVAALCKPEVLDKRKLGFIKNVFFPEDGLDNILPAQIIKK